MEDEKHFLTKFGEGGSEHDHNTISSSNGQNEQIFQQFQQISTTKKIKIWKCRKCHDQIWIDHFDLENFGDGHGQNWLDHFDYRTSILAKWSKNRGHRTPPP
jgi:hypothetical protein